MTDAAAPAAPPTAPAPKTPSWAPARSGPALLILFTLAIVVGMLAILAAWRLPPFTTAVQRTEDAYVYGHTTVISPQVAGYVWKVPVDDFEPVRRGQVLVVIDPRTYQQELAQAEARLAVSRTDLANNAQNVSRTQDEAFSRAAAIAGARASVDQVTAELRRTMELVADGSVSARENEANIAALAAAKARLQEARAQRRTAEANIRSTQVNGGALQAAVQEAQAAVGTAALQLERTVVRAPQDGRLSEVGVKEGQYVASGAQLLFLVPSGYWVTANFKERETRRMRVGQRAWFTVDALGGERVYGRVERLSPATDSQFSVLRPDNATGNFTKVPQRIAVRIAIDPKQGLSARLKPGMSVEASVDTAS